MKKKLILAAMLLLLTLSLAIPALAEGGNGDGSGGGTDEPLALVGSSVPDGSTGVALDTQITLTFNKNVVNMAVKENNMGCFTLQDSNGGAVAISVLMGDDQVDPNIKRIITIKPKVLQPDTMYVLTISKNLTSKSGVPLGQDMTLTFTTVSAPPPSPSTPAAASPPAKPSPSAMVPPSPDAVPSAVPASPASAPSPAGDAPSAEVSAPVPAETPETAPSASAPTAQPQQPDSGSGSDLIGKGPASPVIYIAAAAVIIVVAVAITVIIRKKK